MVGDGGGGGCGDCGGDLRCWGGRGGGGGVVGLIRMENLVVVMENLEVELW